MANPSLKTKILLSMIPFVAGMAIISTFAVRDLGDVKDSLDRMLNLYGKRNQLGNDAIRAFADLKLAQVGFIHAKTKQAQAELLKEEDADMASAKKYVSEYLAMAGDFAKANLPKAQEKLKGWADVDREVRRLVDEGKAEAALDVSLTRGSVFEQQFKKILDACYESSGTKMKEEAQKGINTYARARWFQWLITLCASLFGFALTNFIVGKLASTIDQIIQGLNENSGAVGRASIKLADSSQRTSQGATEQAASLEETAASIEEMNAMVKKNADNAMKSLDVSNTSQEAATQGRRVVEEMISAIEEINRGNAEIVKQVEASNREISEIVKVITEIGNKTKVINDIVFQTKLLSFNASVEAARAGEHGKGFAVVAEEVGNLAQMSGKAATEISSMLGNSIQKVEKIISTTKANVEGLVNGSKQKVESGAQVARRCGEVLAGIVQNVTEVNQRITEISTATQEQSKGIEEINKAMGQLDQVTQSNAAGAEQAANAANELSSQAEALDVAVKELVTVIQGGSPGTTAPKQSNRAPTVTKTSKNEGPAGESRFKPASKETEEAKSNVVQFRSTESKLPSRDDVRFKDA